jgi:hypothetical protein
LNTWWSDEPAGENTGQDSIISILISILLLFAGYQYGKMGDCRPDEIDGQCGLSTVVGTVYGFLGALLVFASTVTYSIYSGRRDSAQQESSRDSDRD